MDKNMIKISNYINIKLFQLNLIDIILEKLLVYYV